MHLGDVGPQRKNLAISRGSLGQPPGTMFALGQGNEGVQLGWLSGRRAGRRHQRLSSLVAGNLRPIIDVCTLAMAGSRRRLRRAALATAPSRSTAAALEFGQQRLEIRFVAAPPRHRTAVERLADLNVAGGRDRPAGFVKAQAAIVPGQAAIIDQPPGLLFQVVDHVLVRDVEHGAGRQNRSPVVHQLVVPAVIAAQLGQVVAELLAGVKSLEKHETQVSTGSRMVWMIRALGRIRRIRPT